MQDPIFSEQSAHEPMDSHEARSRVRQLKGLLLKWETETDSTAMSAITEQFKYFDDGLAAVENIITELETDLLKARAAAAGTDMGGFS